MPLLSFRRAACVHTVLSASVFWGIVLGQPIQAAAPATRYFSVPAGVAETTLKLFAAQAGTEVVFASDIVGRVPTNAVKGSLTARAALDRLLAGTPLTIVEDGKTGTFVVRRANAPPPPPPEPRAGRFSPMQTKSPLALISSWTALALSSAAAPANSTPPAGGTTAPAEESLILNPFTVTVDQDRGYAASSTLSGTRLNTSLRDVAAAVTVVTPEFMADLGVFTLQDVIGFTANAEYNVQPFNSGNNTGESVRIRGVRVNESTQDFFPNYLPIDAYNVEQISINRGPNSLLFGVGNPAGTLTGTSKRARFQNRGEISASLDRWDGWRATADLNRTIIPDRVALRIAVLRRDTQSFIQPAFWQEDRVFAAGTVQISRRRHWSTTLRLNGEWAQADRVLPNLRTSLDFISPWIDSGSPLVSGVQPAAPGVALPVGVVRAAGSNQLVVVDGSPTPVPILNWINTTRGGLNNFQYRSLTDGAPVPYRINYNGPTRASDYTGKSYRFFLEQEIGPATSLELAYGQSYREIFWVRSGGGDQVMIDTNLTLPNGSPNPNAGRPYVEGNNRVQEQIHLGRQLRLTVSHLLDLRQRSAWLGTHRFGTLLSRDFSTFALNDFFEVNGTPLPGYPARFDNAQNRFVRRSYLFQGEGDVWQSGYGFRDIPAINSNGISSRFSNERPLRNDDRTDSLVVALQSKTLKNRLATTFGYRWDDLEGFSLDPVLSDRNALGEAPLWHHIPLTTTPTSTLKHGTFTAGIVLHLLPQLSFQANQSETSTGAGNFQDMYGNTLPPAMGTGEDYGIKFSLFGNRLTGTLTRYKSTQENQSISSVQALGSRLNDIGRTLNHPALINVNDPRDTQDIVARGYEFELICNPTRAWRIAANASKNNNILTNVNSRAARFLEEIVYPLGTSSGAVILPNGRTVAQEIVDFRANIRNNKTAVEGRQAEELREWNGSLVTSYRLSDGWLKGLSFGGNIQYRGSAIIGVLVDPATNLPDFSRPIKSPAYTLLGVHLRYERRLFKRYDWQLGLHVRNVLDDHALIAKNASATDGAILGSQQLQPRTWMLSSTFKF